MGGYNQNIEDIDELIIKVLNASATPDEVERLRVWISINPENEKAFLQSRNILMAAKHKLSENSYDEDKAWKRLTSDFEYQTNFETDNKKGKRHFYFTFWNVAAIILIAFGIGICTMLMVWKNNIQTSQTIYTQHIVPLGSKSQVILPDGSKVWLNAGSSLKYSQDFNQNSREVILDGEGFFDVVANKHLPFWVKTYGINIKVVGTAFNVKAYRDENIIETTVERGQIKIYGIDKKELKNTIIILVKKQLAKFLISDSQLSKSQIIKPDTKVEVSEVRVINNISTELYTSWKDKRWIIEREELSSLAVKIGRRYDVNISFSSEALKHYIFSGIIEDESLVQVLKIISMTSPITYKLDKKNLILSENKALLEYPTK